MKAALLNSAGLFSNAVASGTSSLGQMEIGGVTPQWDPPACEDPLRFELVEGASGSRMRQAVSPSSKRALFRRAALSCGQGGPCLTKASIAELFGRAESLYRPVPHVIYDAKGNAFRTGLSSKHAIRWMSRHPLETSVSYAIEYAHRSAAREWVDETVFRMEIDGLEEVHGREVEGGLHLPFMRGKKLLHLLGDLARFVREAPASRWKQGMDADYLDVKFLVWRSAEGRREESLISSPLSHTTALRLMERFNGSGRLLLKGYFYVSRVREEVGEARYGAEKLLVAADAGALTKVSTLKQLMEAFDRGGIVYSSRKMREAIYSSDPTSPPSIAEIFEASNRLYASMHPEREERRLSKAGRSLTLGMDKLGDPIVRDLHWCDDGIIDLSSLKKVGSEGE